MPHSNPSACLIVCNACMLTTPCPVPSVESRAAPHLYPAELFFILTSVWFHQFYYLFGFLALVFVILCLTCAEITMVLCYFQLCSEDYHWWWRAYFTSGSAAIYLFGYSAFYFYSKLQISKFVPVLLYFIYMSVISYGFFCL